jgi:hypothetical protein
MADNPFCLDSGASCHLSNTRSDFVDLVPISGHEVIVGGQRSLAATHRGTLRMVVCTTEGIELELHLMDALLVPDLGFRLLSVDMLVERMGSILWDRPTKTVTLYGPGFDLLFQQRGRLWILPVVDDVSSDVLPEIAAPAMEATAVPDALLLHMRYGHPHPAKLRAATDAAGIKLASALVECKDCRACVLAKPHHRSVPRSAATDSAFSTTVMVDMAGPYPPSHQRQRYAVIFAHRGLKYVTVYPISSKDKAPDCLDHYLSVVVPTAKGRGRISVIQTDGGAELTSDAWQRRCAKDGISCRHSPPYTQAKNTAAERTIGTLQNLARALMIQARLPVTFWALALVMAAFLFNRLPHAALNNTAPMTAWNGAQPDLSQVRIFGSKAYVLEEKPQRDSKVAAVAWEGILVGHMDSGAFRVFNKETSRVLERYSVTIHEAICGSDDQPLVFVGQHLDLLLPLPPLLALPKLQDLTSPVLSDSDGDVVAYDDFDDDLFRITDQREMGGFGEIGGAQGAAAHDIYAEEGIAGVELSSNDDSEAEEPERGDADGEFRGSDAADTEAEEAAPLARPQRRAALENRERLESLIRERALSATEAADPCSYKEAMGSPEADRWMEALRTELATHVSHGVFREEFPPRGANIIGNQIVFRKKHGPDGTIESYKVRVVADGRHQRFGVDFFKASSTVVELSHLRVILAAAVLNGWAVHQADVKAAYLNADLEEEVFMWPPRGWKPRQPGMVWRLLKSLYGLKQAGLNWYKTLCYALRDLGFARSTVDYCIFYRRSEQGLVATAFHVDDLVFTGSDTHGIGSTMVQLNDKFQIKRLGLAGWLLGMAVLQSPGKIVLHGELFASQTIHRFGLEECNPISTPLPPQAPLQPNESGEVTSQPYLEAVGCIMYAATTTRPDLAHAASELGQQMHCPSDEHWGHVKRTLRYLKGSLGRQLTYAKEGNKQLVCYVDADFAADKDRKSRTGYVIYLAGAAVDWRSIKQRNVTLSTQEAEYVALCTAARAVVPLRRLCEELGVPQPEPTIIHEDNLAARLLAVESAGMRKAKHIDVQYHYIQELVERQVVTVVQCSTHDQLADALTKSVPREILRRCSDSYFNMA